MTSSRISVIIPLAEASGSRRVGGKAISLARLIEARFSVPRGFVVSADAYRSHLWSSGARACASADSEADDYEQIQSAILCTPLAEDIQLEIQQAYERLSWKIGNPDPIVIVRASSLEDDSGGIYESVTNVCGIEDVKSAILRLWSSLWAQKAVQHRKQSDISSEPAMAVIVQQMIKADLTGSAFTVDPATGDPHRVQVICRECGDENFAQNSYSIALSGRSIEETSERDKIINTAAEKAILIEDVICGPIEVEWAHDSVGLWILQVRRICELPIFSDSTTSKSEDWNLALETPICTFSRDMLRGINWVRVDNGYAHIRVEAEASSDCEKDIKSAARQLKKWNDEDRERVRPQAMRILRLKVAGMGLVDLQVNLAQAVRAASSALESLGEARLFSAIVLAALKSSLPDQSCLFDLIDGLADPVVERDARVQELGERISVAEVCGRLNDDKWVAGYKHDAREFVLDYGGSFGRIGEMFDIAIWKNWIEDSEAVYRIVGALDAHERPSLLAAHCAAVNRAYELAHSADFHKKRFLATLAAARGWLAARDDIELACSQSLAAVRHIIVELGKQMKSAGVLADEADIFALTLDDILALSIDISDDERKAIASMIAARKHDFWLESRLAACDISQPENTSSERTLRGTPASPGTVSGKLRFASTIAEAGEVREGEILILSDDGLAWTPFVGAASGVVLEYGSEFSAISRIARECGVPAVVRCAGIISSVREGGRVTVNGSTGEVQVIPGAGWE